MEKSTVREFLKNANPLKTPERVLTAVGWGLALIFGLLLLQQDRSFEEVPTVRPRPQPPTARPTGQSTPDNKVYQAIDIARHRLRHKDPRRALEAISRAWTLCQADGAAPPAELHSLFAEAMAELVAQSRPSQKTLPPARATARPALEDIEVTSVRAVNEGSTRTTPRAVPERSYPKAKAQPRRASVHVNPDFRPPLPPPDRPGAPARGDYQPPAPPPGMPGPGFPPGGMRGPGPGGHFPPPPPGQQGSGRMRDRHPSYPAPPPGFPPPRGYEPPDSPPGY